MKTDPPVILLSGMGADDRVFADQKRAIPAISTPSWPQPKSRESLNNYAQRFAKAIDPGCPCYIGGASFGGMIAMEMIQHLQTLGCILVGSVRSSEELPSAVKMFRGMADMTRALPIEVGQVLGRLVLSSSRPTLGHHLAAVCEQVTESEAEFLRWASWAILKWDGPSGTTTVPIYQIHGSNDRVLPTKMTHPDVIVSGAGHALSMSHPNEVTEFILAVIKRDRRTRQ